MEGNDTPHCHVCEGVKYYLNAGFYYCKECHTQSLGYRQTLLDRHANTENVVSQRCSYNKHKTPKTKKEKLLTDGGSEVEWTSWEGHNFVLKGLVDELISLGARPELKTIVLQLWVKYLGKLEVAFTSTTEKRLPKFGLNQTAKDHMIIYGQIKKKTKKLQKLLLKNKSEQKNLKRLSQDTTLTERNKRNIAKRLCIKAEHKILMAEIASSQDVLSQIDERLKLMASAKEASDAKKKATKIATTNAKSVEYNKRAKEALEKLQAKRDVEREFESSDEDVHNKEVEKGMRKDKRLMLFANCYDSMHLTRSKVLALLILGLSISKDDIQISDLLRWMKEGHVSYNNVTQFFPKGFKFSESDVMFVKSPPILRYKTLQTCVADVTSLLGMSAPPTPDYAGLAHRYISELELPAGLALLTERLLGATKPWRCAATTTHEAIAMGYVVVALKTLLGLDGLTEHRVSDFARRINSLMDEDEDKQLEPKLFVWDDWVRYVMCRRAVVMNEHCPTRFSYNENQLSTSVDSYVHWCHKYHDGDSNLNDDRKVVGRKSRHKEQKKRIVDMQRTLNTLGDTTSAKEFSQTFAPSLTPQSSYLRAIRSRWCAEGYSGCDTLAYTHSLTDIAYLVKPKRVIRFARRKGVHVVVQESRANQEVEVIASSAKKGVLQFPRLLKSKVLVDLEHDKLDEPDDLVEPADGEVISTPKRENNRKSNKETHSKMTTKLNLAQESLCDKETENEEGYSQKSTKRKRADSTRSLDSVDESSSLTLYTPFTEYWIYKVHQKQPEIYFTTEIESKFPESFHWLLNECSNILEMTTADLYKQVRLVESLCFKEIDVSELKLVPSKNQLNCSTVE